MNGWSYLGSQLLYFKSCLIFHIFDKSHVCSAKITALKLFKKTCFQMPFTTAYLNFLCFLVCWHCEAIPGVALPSVVGQPLYLLSGKTEGWWITGLSLYPTLLECGVPWCTLLYCVVLYRTNIWCFLSDYTVLSFIFLYSTKLYWPTV